MNAMPLIPPTVQHRPQGLIDCAQITDTLIFPGQDRQVVYDQVRGLLTAGHLHPSAREERGKKAFLLAPENMLIADVMLRMRDFGMRGADDAKADPYVAAGLTLRHWSGGKPGGAKSNPAAHVIAEYEIDVRGWVFELWSFRHAKRDRVQFEGRIHHVTRRQATNLRHGGKPSWIPCGCYAVDLTDALDRWHPRGQERREAMN
ncbi:hypothetical protein FIU89_14695 [Roseovarius sp. THAF27]|uniref:hypothetical protein n=1 Tax=Roseovarius sp. THAF27 TaxID=2587850 RepID=UPI001268CD56|nr:hypothetical protein [Roseovarius sp. THAF27]QFT81869.1 hypothetical protein FIU89_14695 [Roseovarius sp. THAF27]